MTFSDINTLGAKRIPFLFISDFKAQNLKVILLDSLEDIEFEIQDTYVSILHDKTFEKTPITFSKYLKKFNKIIEEIKSGNTYLLNLTAQTKIQTSLHLKEIYS